jgi:hypothetical protein
VDQEVGGEVAVARVAAVAHEADAVGDAEPPRQPAVAGGVRVAGDQQAERPARGHPADGVQQRLQPLEAVVHGDERRHRLVGADAPALPQRLPPGRAVVLGEPARVDGGVDHAHPLGGDAVILAEVALHHRAVDDDQRPVRAEVLAALQQAEGPVGHAQPLAEPGEPAQQRVAVLAQVVLGGGGVQAALRVEHVLAPGLVEADRHQLGRLGQRLPAQRPEDPRPQEARAARPGEAVVAHAGRQGGGVPLAAEQVDLVPLGVQPAGQVGDVHLAAAAGRQDALVAEGNFHRPAPPPTS